MESWSISASQFLLKEVEFGVGDVKREIVQWFADEFSDPIFWTEKVSWSKSYCYIYPNTVYWNEIRVGDWSSHFCQLNPIGRTIEWFRIFDTIANEIKEKFIL